MGWFGDHILYQEEVGEMITCDNCKKVITTPIDSPSSAVGFRRGPLNDQVYCSDVCAMKAIIYNAPTILEEFGLEDLVVYYDGDIEAVDTVEEFDRKNKAAPAVAEASIIFSL